MRYRLAALLASTLLLSGCSMATRFYDRYFPGDASVDTSTPRVLASATGAPPPAAAPGAPDPFCAAVAHKDIEEGDFDAATQQRMLNRSYQQCVEMFRTQ